MHGKQTFSNYLFYKTVHEPKYYQMMPVNVTQFTFRNSNGMFLEVCSLTRALCYYKNMTSLKLLIASKTKLCKCTSS